MSHVGRAQRRSIVVKPASPKTPVDAELLHELGFVEAAARGTLARSRSVSGTTSS